MDIKYLSKDNITEITNVLCDAFYNYPVMRYVLGEKPDYDKRLQKLIGFFVSARLLRKEPVIGIFNADCLLTSVLTITLPEDIPVTEELSEYRNKLWEELGEEEKNRYRAYSKAAGSLLPSEPHHHINMIGVRRKFMGTGLSRILMNEAEKIAASHPDSTGISLNTEDENNVKYYLHLGYKIIGHSKVDNELETWAFLKSRM
jgi:GNAT superfamily N-acetyltransferase